MKRSELKSIMNRYTILECEVENAIEFVNDLLYSQRKEIEKNEPYATKTISDLKRAENLVWDLLGYIEECEEDD